MEFFLHLLILGIAVGAIYAVVALGFVLIYKSTRVLNFAQGTLVMIGAFMAYAFLGHVLGVAIFAVHLSHIPTGIL